MRQNSKDWFWVKTGENASLILFTYQEHRETVEKGYGMAGKEMNATRPDADGGIFFPEDFPEDTRIYCLA